MFTQVYSGGIQAVDGCIVSVEADVSDGLPFFNISGQLSTEVRESQNRDLNKPEKMPIGLTSLSFYFWISKYLTRAF